MLNIAVISLIAGGAYYLYNLNKTGGKLSINPTAIGKPSVKGGNIILTSTLTVDNPTSTELKLKKPYLRGYINGEEVGNSIPENKEYIIKENTRTLIQINLAIPLINIPTIATALINSQKAGIHIGVEAEYTANGITDKAYKEFEL